MLSDEMLERLRAALVPGRPIAIDCDGVILDYDQPFSVIASEVLRRPVQKVNNIYELHIRYDLSIDELNAVFTAYREHPSGLRGLPLIEGADRVIRELRTMGHPLHMVTGIDPDAHHLRLENLGLYGIEFDEIHCVGAGMKSKKDVLLRLDPCIFLDDRLHLLAEADHVPHRVWIDRDDDQYGHECPSDIVRVKTMEEWFHGVLSPAVHKDRV